MNSLFSYNNLVHAVSGGCGSAIAMSSFYPLDTVRTRLQLEKRKQGERGSTVKISDSVLKSLVRIYHNEGKEGLYKGLIPVIQSLYCSNFVYFYSFHGLKRAFNPEKTAMNDLLCGMAAGIINVLSTTPLWVVNTRIKMQSQQSGAGKDYFTSIPDGLVKVYNKEGVKGLWSSVASSLILVINPAIQFMVYETMKRRLTASGGGAPNGLLVFLSGASAKAIATCLTYPIQLAQAKQRAGANLGVLLLLRSILKEEGPKGLFRGLSAKLLQTVLTAALMFLCYEKIAALVFAVMKGQRPSK